MDTATWKATTQEIVDELAKAHKVSPAELVTLLKFVPMGVKLLNARPTQTAGRLQAAS